MTSSSSPLELLQSQSSLPYILPEGTKPLENQVAGHTFQEGTNSIGLLKDNHSRTVLKPLGKPICGAKEVNFYKTLQSATTSDLLALKKLIPEFKGTVRMEINSKEVEFIRLEDITYGMEEPCVMDVKIGKRTWDPNATPEKIQAEEEKYADCKKTLGLCIPGFQVYSLLTNKLKRYGKDYGKQLNQKTLINALKIFLNFDYGCSKILIQQILKYLWQIQKWSRTQKSMKLYSSSILICYDAKRLKYYLDLNFNKQKILNNSINSDKTTATTTFNLPSNINNSSSKNQNLVNGGSNRSNSSENHVSENSGKSNGVTHHHESLSSIDGLARVKMIDFAHAFPVSPDDSEQGIDTNYLFGIESLVRIFEGFLTNDDSTSPIHYYHNSDAVNITDERECYPEM